MRVLRQGAWTRCCKPQDGVQSADDLDTLLAEAGEHGPYVLVGHSTGGTYAMTYAARYPDQVAGLVVLDSSSPEQFTRMPASITPTSGANAWIAPMTLHGRQPRLVSREASGDDEPAGSMP